MIVLDADMRITLWNRRVFELMEVPETICRVGMSMAELIDAMRRAQGLPPGGYGTASMARLKDPSQGNTAALSPDISAAVRSSAAADRSRRRHGGHLADVTEARQREREIAEKSTLLAATLEGMDQGIMVLDADRNVRMWNERLIEHYDLPPTFLRVGMPMTEVVEQLARQGQFGDGDPVALAKARVEAIQGEAGRTLSRRATRTAG